MIRKDILSMATERVMQKVSTHGAPENSFGMIADLWNSYLAHTSGTITPEDVASMMMLLKVARANQGGAASLDHYVDMAGYAALAGELRAAAENEEASLK